MCFRRSDGRKVKNMGITEAAAAYFMPTRAECVNYFTEEFRCAPMDDFISRERKNGVSFSYTHLMVAGIVRLFYLRPKLNYFINNCVMYEHKKIVICMAVKTKLSDDGEETEMKMEFTGRENIYEIKDIVDKSIENVLKTNDSSGKTNKAAKTLNHLPAWLFRMFMAIMRWADRHNMMPKALIKASPFHCSCFITHLKSIKQDAILHHLYNFGTCSIFVAVGKEKIQPVIEGNKEIKMAKIMKVGFSLDDRTADGFYYVKSLKLLREILANPDCLKESMPDDGSKKMVIKKRKKTKKAKKVKKSKEQIVEEKIFKKKLKDEEEKIREEFKEKRKVLSYEEKIAYKSIPKNLRLREKDKKEKMISEEYRAKKKSLDKEKSLALKEIKKKLKEEK